MTRYKKLSAPEEILDEGSGDEWAIRFRWSVAVDAEPSVLLEHCFAWVLTIARKGTGTAISPLRVQLVQPRSHAQALHFGCPIACGAICNALVFRPEDAQLPFVTRNAELLAMLDIPQTGAYRPSIGEKRIALRLSITKKEII